MKRFSKVWDAFKQKAEAFFRPKIITGTLNESRGTLIAVLFAIGFIALLTRAVIIHVFPPSADFLNRIAKHQYTKKVELAPYRGNIYDRRGEALALSVKKPSFYVNPRIFRPSAEERERLARILGISAQKIESLTRKTTYFSWLKRQVSDEASEKVKALAIAGLFEVKESARYYPLGDAASQLIGFVGIDNQGLSGLEYIHEKNLRGEPLLLNPAIDARGYKIYLSSQHAVPYEGGDSIQLTIDRAIQEIVEEELEKGVRQADAKGGMAIVADPHTGQILAMANYPRPSSQSGLSSYGSQNHAVVDIFEPGSITKPFVIAAALDQGVVSATQEHQCEKSGHYRIPGGVIHDDHPHEVLDTAGVLVESSNICTYKIAKRLGPQRLADALHSFGISHDAVRLGYPGEVGGRIAKAKGWREMRFANVSFGQGFSVTALEVVAAYGAIANGGQLFQPYLVSQIKGPSGQVTHHQDAKVLGQVLKPKTAAQVRSMLETVTLEGTGTKAQTLRYTVAGKTGTAEVFDSKLGQYSKTKRKASFVGFAPASDPQLVLMVLIDEPRRTPYYGGLWAAPVFSQIISRSLDYMNVKPDRIPTLEGERNAQAPSLDQSTEL